MVERDIEAYLEKKNVELDDAIHRDISSRLEQAVQNKEESAANYMWCLEQVCLIQKEYLCAYHCIRNKKYEEAWLKLDSADINLSQLYGQNEVDVSNFGIRFHLQFISEMIPRYVRLFPYRLFTSREEIIKEEKCTICGKVVDIRHQCQHQVGHLYMGRMCGRIVTKCDFLGVAMVTDPFDRYAYLKIVGQDFHYQALDYLNKFIASPFQKWDVEITKELRPEYAGVKRNDKCPCGSGKKYKKCCYKEGNDFRDHYEFIGLSPI